MRGEEIGEDMPHSSCGFCHSGDTGPWMHWPGLPGWLFPSLWTGLGISHTQLSKSSQSPAPPAGHLQNCTLCPQEAVVMTLEFGGALTQAPCLELYRHSHFIF